MNTDKLRELALAADRCGYDSWEHTRFKNEANPTAIIELTDALREIGELLPRCETIHKLGVDYDKEDGSVTRWSMGVSIAAQGRRLAIELKAILDKL